MLRRHKGIHTAESRDASLHRADAMMVVTPRAPGREGEEVMNEWIHRAINKYSTATGQNGGPPVEAAGHTAACVD